MAGKRFGGLPPRYRFILNPYAETRLSRCPQCRRPTHPRKFPLLIHVETFGPFVLGKTCRYCANCELIIAHQDELERVMAAAFSGFAPQAIGNDYLVLGTVERAAWKKGMAENMTFEGMRAHAADFKGYLTLEYDPGGWGPSDR